MLRGGWLADVSVARPSGRACYHNQALPDGRATDTLLADRDGAQDVIEGPLVIAILVIRGHVDDVKQRAVAQQRGVNRHALAPPRDRRPSAQSPAERAPAVNRHPPVS